MKKYVFTSVASLSLFAVSCAQQFEPPLQPVPGELPGEEVTPPVTPKSFWDNGRLLPTSHPTTAYESFFVEPTTYVSKLKAEAWFAKPVTKPHFGSLTVNGNLPEMIAFGGGMTAGVSNGGLNREGQQFAYPNLVAHQMGIKDFKTPLLSESEANGSGIFLYENPQAEYPRWREVKNNLAALEPGKPVKMKPFEGLIHNFAAPGGSSRIVIYPYCSDCPIQTYVSRFSSYTILKDSYMLGDIRKKQPFNFVIFDDFFDSYMYWISRAERLDNRFGMAYGTFPQLPSYGMEHVLDNNQKGVLFTVPHFKHMGFMNWYKTEDLLTKVSSISLIYTADYKGTQTDGSKTFFLKPTPTTESLFSLAQKGKPLKEGIYDQDIIDAAEYWLSNPDSFINPAIRQFADKHNLALVDLRKIYEDIYEGRYVTASGLRIDGSMKGNFFSSDGIYPTPLGQAVIANEVIRAINQKYGSQIDLINIQEFISTVQISK